MKRGGRKSRGTVIKLNVKRRQCNTARQLLENTDVSMLALERGQSDMSTEECVIEEELRPADFVEDGTKQVCHLIIFRMSYLGMTLTGYSPHEERWGIPLFFTRTVKKCIHCDSLMYSMRHGNAGGCALWYRSNGIFQESIHFQIFSFPLSFVRPSVHFQLRPIARKLRSLRVSHRYLNLFR